MPRPGVRREPAVSRAPCPSAAAAPPPAPQGSPVTAATEGDQHADALYPGHASMSRCRTERHQGRRSRLLPIDFSACLSRSEHSTEERIERYEGVAARPQPGDDPG